MANLKSTPSRGNWHPTEDSLIRHLKTQSPPATLSTIVAQVNALADSPGTRTGPAVRFRWEKVLRHDDDVEEPLGDVELAVLRHAYEDVREKEFWSFVAERYKVLAEKREDVAVKVVGKGRAKRELSAVVEVKGEMEGARKRKRGKEVEGRGKVDDKEQDRKRLKGEVREEGDEEVTQEDEGNSEGCDEIEVTRTGPAEEER